MMSGDGEWKLSVEAVYKGSLWKQFAEYVRSLTPLLFTFSSIYNYIPVGSTYLALP